MGSKVGHGLEGGVLEISVPGWTRLVLAFRDTKKGRKQRMSGASMQTSVLPARPRVRAGRRARAGVCVSVGGEGGCYMRGASGQTNPPKKVMTLGVSSSDSSSSHATGAQCSFSSFFVVDQLKRTMPAPNPHAEK